MKSFPDELQVEVQSMRSFQTTGLEKESASRAKTTADLIAQAVGELTLSGKSSEQISPKDLMAAIRTVQPDTTMNLSTLWRWRGCQTHGLQSELTPFSGLSFSEHHSPRWENSRRARLKQWSKTDLVTYLVGLEALEEYYSQRQKRIEGLTSSPSVDDYLGPAFTPGAEVEQRYVMHFRKRRADELIKGILKLEQRLAELQAHLQIADQKFIAGYVKSSADKK